MLQADSWEDMKDDAGNTLNIGKLEYKTKHGKKPGSFLDKVFPRDAMSALCLLVNLFLEQPKVNSLTAIDGHDRQYFNELRSTVVSRRIFIRSQSLIAC